MDKKGDFVWDKMGNLILIMVLLVVLMLIVFFLTGSFDEIWAKIIKILRFGG